MDRIRFSKSARWYLGGAPEDQRGLVLVVALIVLLVLTLLSVSSFRGTSLEQKMASNEQSKQQAFQLASAALRQGEQDIAQILHSRTATVAWAACPSGLVGESSGGGYYEYSSCGAAWTQLYAGTAYTNRDVLAYTGATSSGNCGSGNAIERATFFIERVAVRQQEHYVQIGVPDPNSLSYVYLITAQGLGPDCKAKVVLQSSYQPYE